MGIKWKKVLTLLIFVVLATACFYWVVGLSVIWSLLSTTSVIALGEVTVGSNFDWMIAKNTEKEEGEE